MIDPKFTAKIKGSEETITGYYCPHLFEGSKKHEPAIIVHEANNISSAYEIELETLRPAEEN